MFILKFVYTFIYFLTTKLSNLTERDDKHVAECTFVSLATVAEAGFMCKFSGGGNIKFLR